MGYQTLPWQDGDSDSFGKLDSLMLPYLKEKRVLDVGCNTGFFCGLAAFQGAAYVKGIDKSPKFIAQAKEWFPECDFVCQGWDDLDDEKYDLVLCLSAIHYAEDQEALIHKLMRRVNPNGALVLELGLSPGEDESFVAVKRFRDTRLYPTSKKIRSILSPYSFKIRGYGIKQNGDPIPRYVFHIHHKKPYAILLLGESYSGKTSMCHVFKEDIQRISGDFVLGQFVSGKVDVPEELMPIVASHTPPVHYGKMTNDICSKGLLVDYLKYLEGLAGGKDFILDAYFKEPFTKYVARFFEGCGYFIADMGLGYNTIEMNQFAGTLANVEYIRHLHQRGLVNEKEYCEANPDVAAAIADGKMPNSQYHYFHFGRHEGRKTKK